MSTTKLVFMTAAQYQAARKKDPSIACEPYDPETQTVQGETYTIPELFARHLKGTDPGISRAMIDFNTEDFDAIDADALRRMDLVEQEEHLGILKRQAAEAEKRIRDFRLAAGGLQDERPPEKGSGAKGKNERSGETDLGVTEPSQEE